MYPALLAAAVSLIPVTSETMPPTPGTIAIVAVDAQTATDPVVATFLTAIRRAILQTAFLPLPDGGHSRYVAKVAVLRHQLVLSRQPATDRRQTLPTAATACRGDRHRGCGSCMTWL